MKILTVQPAASTDQITEDGTELTRLPYPFHCDKDGNVQRQDFWRGKPLRVVGFAADLAVHKVDLRWREAFDVPTRALGMYVVSQNADGSVFTHLTAVESVRAYDAVANSTLWFAISEDG